LQIFYLYIKVLVVFPFVLLGYLGFMAFLGLKGVDTPKTLETLLQAGRVFKYKNKGPSGPFFFLFSPG
jgi:hypothetical protein